MPYEDISDVELSRPYCHYSISFFIEDSDDDSDEIGKTGFSVDIKYISIIQICLEKF